MNEAARKLIEKYIRQAVTRKGGAVDAIVIHQVDAKGTRSKESLGGLDCSELDPETGTDERIRAWSQEIFTQCEDFTSGLEGGAQRFELRFMQDSKVAARRCVTFHVDGPDDMGQDEEMMTEPATMAGQLRQQMRHGEGMMRMLVGSIGQIVSTQGQVIAQLAEQASAANKQQMQAINAYAEVMTAKQEREVELEAMRAKARREEQIFDAARGLVPALIGRAQGTQKLTGEGSLIEQQITALIDSLDKDQLMAIAPTLTPLQQSLMFEIIEARNNAKEEKAAKERAASAASANGSANTANGEVH